jgi:hypothetical protein
MRYASPLRNGRSGTRDERFEKLSNGSRDRAVVLFQLTTAWITKRKQAALRTSTKSAPINGINAHPKLGYEVVRKHLGEVSHRLAKHKEMLDRRRACHAGSRAHVDPCAAEIGGIERGGIDQGQECDSCGEALRPAVLSTAEL